MSHFRIAAAVVLGSASGALLGYSALAGGDKIAFPENYDKANLTGCFQCHKPHAGQDFVISLARLKGTQEGAMAKPTVGPGVVSIADFKFGPEMVVVEKGQTVTWHNADSSPTR